MLSGTPSQLISRRPLVAPGVVFKLPSRLRKSVIVPCYIAGGFKNLGLLFVTFFFTGNEYNDQQACNQGYNIQGNKKFFHKKVFGVQISVDDE